MPGLTPVFHPDAPQTLARFSRRAGLPLTAPPSIWRRRSFQTAPTQGFCAKRSENSLRRAFLKPRGAGI